MQAWDELGHETQLQWEKSNRDYYRSPFKNVLKIPNSAFGFDEPIQIADDKEINIHTHQNKDTIHNTKRNRYTRQMQRYNTETKTKTKEYVRYTRHSQRKN